MQSAQQTRLRSQLCALESKTLQLKLAWFSPRVLAVIFEHASTGDCLTLRRNLGSRALVRIDEEIASLAIARADKAYIEDCFQKLNKALSSDTHSPQLKDRGFKKPLRRRS